MEYKINEIKRSKIYEIDANNLRVLREAKKVAKEHERMVEKFERARIIPYEILRREVTI